MKNVLWITFVFLLASCGNSAVDVKNHTDNFLLEDLANKKIKTGDSLEFKILKSNLSSFESYKIDGFMKCCKSPLEIEVEEDSEHIYIFVKEFWSPGTYVIRVKTFDENNEVLGDFENEIFVD